MTPYCPRGRPVPACSRPAVAFRQLGTRIVLCGIDFHSSDSVRIAACEGLYLFRHKGRVAGMGKVRNLHVSLRGVGCLRGGSGKGSAHP